MPWLIIEAKNSLLLPHPDMPRLLNRGIIAKATDAKTLSRISVNEMKAMMTFFVQNYQGDLPYDFLVFHSSLVIFKF